MRLIILFLLVSFTCGAQSYTFDRTIYNAGIDDDYALINGYLIDCTNTYQPNHEYWETNVRDFLFDKHISSMLDRIEAHKKTIDWLFEIMPCPYSYELITDYTKCIQHLSDYDRDQLKIMWLHVNDLRASIRLYELNIQLLDTCTN